MQKGMFFRYIDNRHVSKRECESLVLALNTNIEIK